MRSARDEWARKRKAAGLEQYTTILETLSLPGQLPTNRPWRPICYKALSSDLPQVRPGERGPTDTPTGRGRPTSASDHCSLGSLHAAVRGKRSPKRQNTGRGEAPKGEKREIGAFPAVKPGRPKTRKQQRRRKRPPSHNLKTQNEKYIPPQRKKK